MIKSTLTEDETEVKTTSDDQHHGPQHDDSPTLEKFDLHVKHRGTPQYCHKRKYLTCYSIWCVESQHQDLLAWRPRSHSSVSVHIWDLIINRTVYSSVRSMLEDIEATKETLSNLNSTYLARYVPSLCTHLTVVQPLTSPAEWTLKWPIHRIAWTASWRNLVPWPPLCCRLHSSQVYGAWTSMYVHHCSCRRRTDLVLLYFTGPRSARNRGLHVVLRHIGRHGSVLCYRDHSVQEISLVLTCI